MMHDRNTVAHGQCERARRDAGFAANINCKVCDRGPCNFEFMTAAALTIPNRLQGAAVNMEGEAI